ncbi:MAG: hypothetical protein KU38_10585 [Sulfurovum sp. FS08-3]|nr:MAG: hypothetical protein KU38_10585 [Sulfurovum sp. FS08-3]
MEFKKQLKQLKKALASHPTKPQPTTPPKDSKSYAVCICRDSKGEFKTLYPTQLEALQQANLLLQTKGFKLKTYPCPDTLGWHLTKS